MRCACVGCYLNPYLFGLISTLAVPVCFMVETRHSKATIMPPTKPEDLSARINSSHMNSETKEILKLFLAMFTSLQLERDSKIKTIEKKMTEIQSKNTNLEKELEDIKEATEHDVSILKEEVSSLKTKIKSQENSHSAHVASLNQKLDANEQYERRDALILSGPAVPVTTDREDCKQIILNLLRDNVRLNVNPNDISTAHRIGRKPTGIDKRNIIFKLCRRDLVHDIVAACKSSKPPFFINTSLTPLRNKILYGLRLLKRKYPTIVKGCRSTPTGDVTVYVPPIGVETGEASGEETDESTDGPARGAEDVAAQAPSRSTTRTRDRRITINTKQDLSKFMSDHLKASIASLSIDW